MKDRLKKLIPTSAELIGAFFVSIAVILAANSKQLLSYYGLQSSNQLVQSNGGKVVSDALRSLDSLSATASVVTFLIWAGVGILCFGIVEGMGHAYSELKLENDISSGRYIHPATFTKVKFWRGVVVDSVTLALGLAILALTSLLFGIFLLPLGLAYSRVFLFDGSLAHALYIVLAVALVFIGLILVDIAVRFLLHRRRIAE
ncbi:MAG TPA: hypothetical protein VN031_03960 [Candidatus Microsaccharimonas sp.]|nr:hypothetical protein [Candidatus Microsaccharimonas sp.]